MQVVGDILVTKDIRIFFFCRKYKKVANTDSVLTVLAGRLMSQL